MWQSCHSWRDLDESRVTAMTFTDILNDILNDILTLVFILGVATMVGLALRSEIDSDGHGYRPPPRSHPDDEETRAQMLRRLS